MRHLLKHRISLSFFVAFLFTLTLSPTFAQQFAFPKPTNATDLNLSQTVDGVSVTVWWAYIDRGGALVHYSITPPPNTDMQAFRNRTTLTLYDADRLGDPIFPFRQNLINSEFGNLIGSTGIRGHAERQWVESAYFPLMQIPLSVAGTQVYRYFDYGADLPESINLVFNVAQRQANVSEPAPEVTAEADNGESDTNAVEPEGLTFAFNIPITPPQIIDVNQTVNDKGIDVTLQRALVYYAVLDIEICQSLGDEWKTERLNLWFGEVQRGFILGDDGVPDGVPDGASDGANLDGCNVITQQLTYNRPPASVRVEVKTVTRGSTYPQSLEEWRTIEPLMNRDGYQLDIVLSDEYEDGYRLAGFLDENGMPFASIETASGVTLPRNQVVYEIAPLMVEADLRDVVDGNWAFNAFQIPNGDNSAYAPSPDDLPELIAQATQVGSQTMATIEAIPTSVPIMARQIGYLVTLEAVNPDLPGQDPTLITRTMGAYIINDWQTVLNIASSRPFDLIMIHESAVDWIDRAWITDARLNGTTIVGINIPLQEMVTISGGRITPMEQNSPPPTWDGYFVIHPSGRGRPFMGRMLEAKGDLSTLMWFIEGR